MKPARASAAGFSLVEMMVGVTIGLIGCVIIFQVLSVNEGYKRSTTGGADAQVAGAVGLYTLERDIRMAGFGVNDRTALGCNMIAYTSTRSPATYNLPLVPVQIHSGGANPDVISINTGNPLDFVPGYGLAAAHLAPGGNFRLENRAGVRKWDFLLVSQPDQANCELLNAVNLPLDSGAPVACGGSSTTDAVEVCSGVAKTDADGVQRIYNNGALTGVPTFTLTGDATKNSRFFNLGAEPTFNVYRVINNTLSVCNMRLADCGNTAATNWSPVSEHVVYMKAQYGLDTNGDGVVDAYDSRICRDTTGDKVGDQWTISSDSNGDGLHDTWTPAAPSGPDWSRVTAVRIAIVVRSAQYEKTAVSPAKLDLWPKIDPSITFGNCDGTGSVTATPLASPQYRVPDLHYRYRIFETIVPIRNAIWMPG